jgi:hypothetical protein
VAARTMPTRSPVYVTKDYVRRHFFGGVARRPGRWRRRGGYGGAYSRGWRTPEPKGGAVKATLKVDHPVRSQPGMRRICCREDVGILARLSEDFGPSSGHPFPRRRPGEMLERSRWAVASPSSLPEVCTGTLRAITQAEGVARWATTEARRISPRLSSPALFSKARGDGRPTPVQGIPRIYHQRAGSDGACSASHESLVSNRWRERAMTAEPGLGRSPSQAPAAAGRIRRPSPVERSAC